MNKIQFTEPAFWRSQWRADLHQWSDSQVFEYIELIYLALMQNVKRTQSMFHGYAGFLGIDLWINGLSDSLTVTLLE